MKKILSIFFAALLMVALVGCNPETEAEKLVIARWGGNDAETSSFDQVVEDFQALHPDLEIEVRVYTDYNTELQAEIIAGEGPDVFYVDVFMAPFFIEQGILAELDAEEYNIADYYGNLVDAFSADGKHYAVPKDYSTLALYYNKAVISDPSTIPTTLEELLGTDYLSTLTLTDTMEIPMTLNADLARNMYLAQTGGEQIMINDVANFGDKDVIANLELFFSALTDGKAKRPSDISTGWNGDAFGNQKTALMIEGNWVVGFLRDNFPELDYGTLEIPTFEGENGSMLFTVGWGVNANAANPEMAAAWVNYFCGTEGMTTWASGTGVLPPRADVAADLNVATDEILKAHVDAV